MKGTDIVSKIRTKQPAILHLTSEAVMNFSANGLLAFGGSPMIAKEPEEAAELAGVADGVLLNTGTVVKADIEAMISAGKVANERGIPVVLDPVGVGSTTFRRKAVMKLLREVQVTAIKGNAGEMASLIDREWQMKGFKSAEADADEGREIAIKIAKGYGVMAIVTGAVDYISDGTDVVDNKNGHYFISRILGTGCLLGSLVAAGLTVDARIEKVGEVIGFYGRAGELAVSKVAEIGVRSGMRGAGTGMFSVSFIDALGV